MASTRLNTPFSSKEGYKRPKPRQESSASPPQPWLSGIEAPSSQCHAPALSCVNAYHSLSWQAPSAGKYIVLLGEEPEHAVQVASQQVLTADLYHAWKMVDFLKEVQMRNRISEGTAGILLETRGKPLCRHAEQEAGPVVALNVC